MAKNRYFLSYAGMPVLPGDLVDFGYREGSTSSPMVALGTFKDSSSRARVAVAFLDGGPLEIGHYGLARECRVIRRSIVSVPRFDLAGDFRTGFEGR